MRPLLPSSLALGLLLGLAPPAHALGPIDVEVGAKVGAGTNPVGGGLPDPMGLGLGGRAGVALSGLYLGVSVVDSLGATGQLHVVEGPDFEEGTLSPHSLLYGLEAGYGIPLAHRVLLRAQLGVGQDRLGMGGGLAVGTTLDNIVDLPQPVATTTYLYLEPAIVALVTLGHLYAGVDVGALLLPSGPSVAPPGTPFLSPHRLDGATTAHAQVGVRF